MRVNGKLNAFISEEKNTKLQYLFEQERESSCLDILDGY